MPTSKITNGCTVSFAGSTIVSPTQLNYGESAPAVTTSGWDATQARQEAGVPVLTFSITYAGSQGNHDAGDTGALAVTFTDGGSVSLGNAEINSVAVAGSMDSVLTTTLGFISND